MPFRSAIVFRLACRSAAVGATPSIAVAIVAVAGVLLSADVHLDLWYSQGFRDIPTIGPLFLLNAVSGVLIGLVVLSWSHWLPPLVAAGFGAGTLAAFYLSVSVGLFGLHEVASGQPQVLAEIAEYVAVVFGGLASWMLWRQSR